MSTQEPTFSHSGQRYLLGYTVEEYGIWDRQAPGPPVQRFPKSDLGWNQAWTAYQGLEASPTQAPVTAQPQTAAAAPAAGPTAPTAQMPASGAPAMQYPAQTAAAPRAPMQISNQLLASVLNFGGWAALALFVLTGIAWMTNGGFTGVTFGLALISVGPVLWAIGQTLAKWVSKNG
jgi:hypothetical protein